jgi:predicted Fe-S protein YdhL (DUF1289 family)
MDAMSFVSKPRGVKSPCVNVCVMDEDSGYCLGCKRTLDEIAGWGAAPDSERLKVIARLQERDVPEWEPAPEA